MLGLKLNHVIDTCFVKQSINWTPSSTRFRNTLSHFNIFIAFFLNTDDDSANVHFYGLVQNCNNSIAKALELL